MDFIFPGFFLQQNIFLRIVQNPAKIAKMNSRVNKVLYTVRVLEDFIAVSKCVGASNR